MSPLPRPASQLGAACVVSYLTPGIPSCVVSMGPFMEPAPSLPGLLGLLSRLASSQASCSAVNGVSVLVPLREPATSSPVVAEVSVFVLVLS